MKPSMLLPATSALAPAGHPAYGGNGLQCLAAAWPTGRGSPPGYPTLMAVLACARTACQAILKTASGWYTFCWPPTVRVSSNRQYRSSLR
jgi:hypothetical protein